MALSVLVAVSGRGRVSESVGSYTTVRGSARASRPVFFRPASVMP